MSDWTYNYDNDLAGLEAVVRRHQRPGFTFVDIGANDGVINDPCWPFVARWGWSGVCVEPVPAVFDLLARNYADLPAVQLVRAAISSEQQQFWYVDGADYASSQIGSLDRERVEHSMFGLSLAPEIEVHFPTDQPPPASIDRERRVGTLTSFEPECITFGTLVERCQLDRIDMINIDVEGADWEVLEMIDLDRHQVSLMVVETAGTSDKEKIERHLIDHGFTFTRGYGVFSTVWERPPAAG